MAKKKKQRGSDQKYGYDQHQGDDQKDDHNQEGGYDEQNHRYLSDTAIDFSTIIDIAVRDGKVFQAHQSVLCQTSDFFKAALKPDWNASRIKARTITLPDVDSGTFRLYLHWAYRRKLPKAEPESIPTQSYFRELALCYVLGEALMDVSFKNVVIDCWVELLVDKDGVLRILKSEVIADFCIASQIIYEGTPTNSPARKLFVDIWKQSCSSEECDNVVTKLHKDFLADLVRAYIGTGQQAWFIIHAVDYHDK